MRSAEHALPRDKSERRTHCSYCKSLASPAVHTRKRLLSVDDAWKGPPADTATVKGGQAEPHVPCDQL